MGASNFFSKKRTRGFAPQFRTKVARELKGVGDCGLVYGYFILIECRISHIRSLGWTGL